MGAHSAECFVRFDQGDCPGFCSEITSIDDQDQMGVEAADDRCKVFGGLRPLNNQYIIQFFFLLEQLADSQDPGGIIPPQLVADSQDYYPAAGVSSFPGARLDYPG